MAYVCKLEEVWGGALQHLFPLEAFKYTLFCGELHHLCVCGLTHVGVLIAVVHSSS